MDAAPNYRVARGVLDDLRLILSGMKLDPPNDHFDGTHLFGQALIGMRQFIADHEQGQRGRQQYP